MAVEQNDVVRLVAKMTDVNGSLIENTYYYKNQSAVSVATAAFLTEMEAEMSRMYAAIEAWMPDTLTPFEIECDKVQFTGGELVTIGPVGAIDWTTWSGGTSAGDGLPQGNAAVVTFPTGVAGVNGRKYLGPLVETVQNNGNLVSSSLTALAAYVTEYLAGSTAAGAFIQPIVMSTKQDAAVTMIDGIVRAIMGYQRRRKAGRGI